MSFPVTPKRSHDHTTGFSLTKPPHMPRAPRQNEQQRKRAWVFTIFQRDRDPVPTFDGSTYSIAGWETAPTTGKTHWQCYAHWGTLKSFEQAKALHPGAHVEPAKADAHKNRLYCAKGADFVETGDAPAQGRRTDLRTLTEMLRCGASARTIARVLPGAVLRLHNRFQAYRDIISPPPSYREMVVHVYHGPTGTGKTRKVVSLEPDIYWLPFWEGKKVWFDGYTGQEAICLDDFDGSLDIRLLFQMLDVYARQWPVKGGFIWSHWVRVYITSDRHPRFWYAATVAGTLLWQQLERRISQITLFSDAPPSS